MKKTMLATIIAVVAFSVPALAQNTSNNNNNSATAQDESLSVNAAVAFDGGIANTAAGTVTKDSNNRSVEAEQGGIVADGAVTKDSNNVSVEAEQGGIVAKGNVTKDSGNAEDGSILASGPVNANKAEDGGIAATGDVRKTDIEDSFNKDELEITIGNVNVMVSQSELDGEVTDNSIDLDSRARLTTGEIENRGSAFSGAAGITVVKQNTGINSSMQTSVNVNANVAK